MNDLMALARIRRLEALKEVGISYAQCHAPNPSSVGRLAVVERLLQRRQPSGQREWFSAAHWVQKLKFTIRNT